MTATLDQQLTLRLEPPTRALALVPAADPATTDLSQQLGRLARGWLAQWSGHTATAYRGDLQQWLCWCVAEQLHPLTVERGDLQRWVAELSEHYAPATVARRLTAVRSWYGYLTDEGLLRSSPATRVRSPRVPSQSPTAGLTLEQARALLTVADSSGARDAVVVRLLLQLGLRASELGTLDASDLGHERGHLTLTVRGKGGRVDRLPVPEQLAVALECWLRGRTDGPLLTAGGQRLDRHQVRRVVARLCRRAGVPVVSPHSLRHTTVTLALQAGAPLHRVQDLARHADPATTRRYDRAQQSLDGSAAYQLADLLAGAA